VTEQVTINQDDKVLAGLAHGSILLNLFTGGFGGIIAALVIWLTQKDKSVYAGFQALEAVVYQVAAFLLTMVAFCCWGVLWMLMLLPPLFANPDAYTHAPPAGLWVGMALMVVPFGLWGLTILYGLWGAVRCLGGHDFRYIIIGNWLDKQ
jgi:uncharacterized Tic20 family protein